MCGNHWQFSIHFLLTLQERYEYRSYSTRNNSLQATRRTMLRSDSGVSHFCPMGGELHWWPTDKIRQSLYSCISKLSIIFKTFNRSKVSTSSHVKASVQCGIEASIAEANPKISEEGISYTLLFKAPKELKTPSPLKGTLLSLYILILLRSWYMWNLIDQKHKLAPFLSKNNMSTPIPYVTVKFWYSLRTFRAVVLRKVN